MARTPRPEDDSLGAATRALADATATLTKMLGKQVASAVTTEMSEAVANSLREASRGLADASESVGRRASSMRADERRRDRVDQTRSELLAAAGRVFAARGYEGASVGDIAAEAGYTKGALYAHFGSKSNLFVEFAREYLERDLRTAAQEHVGDLAQSMQASMEATIGDPAMLIALEIIAYGIRHPESRDELGPLWRTSFEWMAARVRDDRLARAGETGGAEGGEVEAPTQEDRDTALGLVAVSNFSVLLGTLAQEPGDTTASGARLVRRMLGE
ncbi:TetR/AcrR family transcriptional regulator [Cellulomonas hominis]